MNLRWLWLDDIDPAFGLTAEQRRLVQKRISQYTREFRVGMNSLDLAYVFVPLTIGSIPIALMMCNIHVPQTFGGLWSFTLPFAAIGWAAGAWIRRLSRRQRINRALRSIGYDVCLRCGYWLRGLGDEVTQCPECGTAREPLPAKSSGRSGRA